MTTPDRLPSQEAEPVYSDISDLLTSIAKKADELNVEAGRKLNMRDLEGYHQTTRERAALIKDLPSILESFEEAGGTVPAKAKDVAASYSGIASRMIEDDNMFGMGVLLRQKGSYTADPNDLEQLAISLRPTDS